MTVSIWTPNVAREHIVMSREANESTKPLMPKATAVWLIENTALTFRQIGAFCGLHDLEVQSIADDEVAVGMVGYDPDRERSADQGRNRTLRGRPGGTP